mmetsp:Transcript_55561/g.66803  ORF Transcript_55561/g.66803 Transcript_55561/m.66803 type:complete len:215 (+) Transcript_55561:384-1028(+)
MDGLFRERSSDEHDWSRDLKTEFMALWDGIVSHENENILIIGATNRPFDVDPAFLRRLSRSFFLGLPAFPTRCELLQRMLEGIPLEMNFCISCVASNMEGYSPSDMKEVLRTAAMIPYREGRNGGLKMDDVKIALERVRPTRWGYEYNEKLREWTMGTEHEAESEEESISEEEGGVEMDSFEVHQEEIMNHWDSDSSDVNMSDEDEDNTHDEED